MKKQLLSILIAFAVSHVTSVVAQDHGHLNAGATAQVDGAQLAFENGSDFSTNSLYVKSLLFATSGKYSNYFQGNITLTSLHATDAFGDPVPGASAPGAFIIAEIVSVEGPSGGEFGFWETNSTTAPTFAIPSGTQNRAYSFELSEAALGAGTPGGDPFGHIHGRRFTATVPGLYTVGFRLLDTSTNGTNGGPIHTPSDVLHVYFQAGYTIANLEQTTNGVSIQFGAGSESNFVIQHSDGLSPTNSWTDLQTIPGGDNLVAYTHENASGKSGFYRLRVEPLP